MAILKDIGSAAENIAGVFAGKEKTSDAPPALKALFIVANRDKGDVYAGMLNDFEINTELLIYGRGTASEEMLRKMGMATPKTVILALVREDKASQVLSYLEEKFKTIRNGKGIAFTVPLSAVMGVAAYKFLSNQPSEEAING